MITAELVHRSDCKLLGLWQFRGADLVCRNGGRLRSRDGYSRHAFRRRTVKRQSTYGGIMAAVPQHDALVPAACSADTTELEISHRALSLPQERPASVPEEVRAYQLDILVRCRAHGTDVVELMPLPARSTGDADWRYSSFVGSRQQYLQEYKPGRVSTTAGANRIAWASSRLCVSLADLIFRTGRLCIGSSLRQITNQMYFAAGDGNRVLCDPESRNSRRYVL